MGTSHRLFKVVLAPPVDVAVHGAAVGHVIVGGTHAQDGLHVAGLAEDATLRGQRVAAQGPELL